MTRALIFITAMSGFALIAWLSGYNFDTRNGWVAYYTIIAIFGSTAFAFWSDK